MIEPEIAFADLNDDAALAEDFLKYLFKTVLEKCSDDLEFFNQFVDKSCLSRLQSVVDQGFVRMDYSEAISILQKTKQKFEYPVEWGLDMQSEHERYLCEQHVQAPVIVMNYPKQIKAFPSYQDDE